MNGQAKLNNFLYVTSINAHFRSGCVRCRSIPDATHAGVRVQTDMTKSEMTDVTNFR